MSNCNYNIIKQKGFEYVEFGSGDKEPLVLLHGLMGALSNFQGIISHFGNERKVIIPILPIFSLPIKTLGLSSLVDFISDFIEFKNLEKIHLVGNSLGGHLAQLYALKHPEKLASMTLTGSSGLFESAMGNSFPRRGNYEYIKKKAEDVFYDPAVATKELVDEVYGVVNDIKKGIRVVITAKSAVRHNLEDKLPSLEIPTLIIWGINDSVTPLWVGEKFHELIKGSRLVKIDKCGHAPMMEKPEEFNQHLKIFIDDLEKKT